MRIIIILLAVFLLVSCEKEIDLPLEKSEPQLVIEATIENGTPPIVILSKSLSYFKQINSEIISSSFVHNATVVVSNGNRDFTLIEDSIKKDNKSILYFYSTKTLLGEIKGKYSLTVKVGNETYTSVTTIPEITRKIDSLWWEKPPFGNDTNNAILMIKATDRPGLGDCIRYFTSVNRGGFLPGLNSVFDDALIDGKTYAVSIDKGVDKNFTLEPGENTFKRGDTITIKLCNIDRATFDFWRTFEFNYQGIGNPFSSPTKILSNISGNTLGYFGGYASQYRTLVIPK